MGESLARGILEIAQTLQTVDIAAFRFINHTLANPVLDPIMVLITQLGLGTVQLCLLALLALRGGPEGKRTALLCLLAFVISGIAVQVLKEQFDRLRPLRVVDDARFLAEYVRYRSFPSGHTSTSFALAWVAGMRHRRWLAPLLVLAMLVAFSRVYVGAHFPGDTLAGALLGIGTGIACVHHGRKRYKA